MDENVPPNQEAARLDEALERHVRLHEPVSTCPLVEGNRVEVMPDARAMLGAMFDAMEAAQVHVHLEYYLLQDVHMGGRTLCEVLCRCLARGVAVTMLYDAFGSKRTPTVLFDTLRQAGARVQEYRPLNPLHRHFSFAFNFRDHRKVLVVDGRIGFLGGVNLFRGYENPPAAGIPANRDLNHAWWLDCGVRIEGPVVAEIQKLFQQVWTQQDAAPPQDGPFPPLEARGTSRVRVAGSSPREEAPLFPLALRAAVAGARRNVLLSTGYFVPRRREWHALVHAARRGVDVCLLLPGVSDVPATVPAGRALYGRLLRAGVRIYQMQNGVLHAKAATIDGVWTAIGSSNFDRRSVRYNNEIDAIVLGHEPAAALEAVLRGWMQAAEPISLEAWDRRSWREKLNEHVTRVLKKLM